jgi:O-succinylbenzoic acid--CoA ligase
MAASPLERVPVPPGSEGAARLLQALAEALTGSGPAIAPVPTVSATVSNDYVASILRALHIDAGLPLESPEVALVVATSGSTGEPRGVLHSAATLTALDGAVHARGARPQWVLALPVTSMGGINVLVRSLAAGRDPIVVPSIGGAGPFTPQAFAAAVESARRRHDDVRVSLVPAQVTRLLSDEAGTRALLGCSQILVGGASLRPSLRDVATSLGVRLISTYGATETAGGCVFDGVPLPGVSVEVDAQTGTLIVGGPSVALGYRAEPDLTRAAFGPRGFLTSDIGRIESDGRVMVIGRADDVVSISGVNVSIGAVDQVLADHPDIDAAAAVVVTDPRQEPALHAFVVVRDGARRAPDDARESVEQILGRAARPLMHQVDALPHLPNGKVDRRLLIEWAATGQEDR